MRLLLRRARNVVALWGGAADTLVSHGIDRRRIVVIPNAVPLSRFPLITREARAAARAGWPALRSLAEAPCAVVLGSLSAEKRVDLAIHAVARLPDIHLVIVGDGPLRSELQQQADEEAPSRVHFLGTTADSATALAVADVVLVSSITEGMPAVLIEAGMSGLPVVSTDVGGVRQIVVPDVTGLLVPPKDLEALTRALRRAVEDPPPAGEHARAHCAAHFDIDVVAASWDELLALT